MVVAIVLYSRESYTVHCFLVDRGGPYPPPLTTLLYFACHNDVILSITSTSNLSSATACDCYLLNHDKLPSLKPTFPFRKDKLCKHRNTVLLFQRQLYFKMSMKLLKFIFNDKSYYQFVDTYFLFYFFINTIIFMGSSLLYS